MALALRQGVHFCVTGGQVIFLDVAADRYFCLPAGAQAAFDRLTRCSALEDDDYESLACLIKPGILTSAASVSVTVKPTVYPPARESAYTAATAASSLLDLIGAIGLQHLARHDLAKRPLSQIFADVPPVARFASEARAQSQQSVDRQIAAFKYSRHFVRTQDQCLRWSLAVVRRLRRIGLDAKLVLGVKMKPFDAHAWVQAGDVVMNDTVERVSSYTPILVV